jgi:hypothetical protein
MLPQRTESGAVLLRACQMGFCTIVAPQEKNPYFYLQI